jgi:hypothetical protein
LVDFDNDGRLDISLSRDKKYEKSYTDVNQKAWFGLMHQKADGSFINVGIESGINSLDEKGSASLTPCTDDTSCSNGEKCLASKCRTPCKQASECSLGHETCHAGGGFCKSLLAAKNAQNHAWSDIDDDGDLDLLIGGRDTGGGRPNFLFENKVGQNLPWIKIRLEGDGIAVNRDAIGARIWLKFTDGQRLVREVKASRGMYNSMDSRWILFGLGDRGCDYQIIVRWPNGMETNHTAKEVLVNEKTTLIYPKQ